MNSSNLNALRVIHPEDKPQDCELVAAALAAAGIACEHTSGYGSNVATGKTGFVCRLKAAFLRKPRASRTIAETIRGCLDEKATPMPGEPQGPVHQSSNDSYG